MSERRVIAYLTSAYARATDTFIRDEVAMLRELGDEVFTYSVRKPDESEVVNAEVARERASTTYLLDLPRSRYPAAVLRLALRSPRRFRLALSAAAALSRPGLRGRAWPVFYLLEACVLALSLRERRVEHLHNHIGEGSASVAMLASLLSGVPYSFTVHGPSEWDVPTEISLDLKARHASFVATISEYTRGQVRRWVGHEDWSKVELVRCGVPALDIDLRSDASPRRQPDSPRLVSVGRLAHEKGHLVLLEALRSLDVEPQPHLVVVGDGPLRAELERVVERAGDDLDVDLVGWRSTTEVHDILRGATALVMPSFAEGLPVSIMEAYSLGKPVISSDVGGVSELVEHGISGWLVDPGSVGSLSRALRELVSLDPAELERRGRIGRQRVRSQHDVATEVRHLRSLIHGSAPS